MSLLNKYISLDLQDLQILGIPTSDELRLSDILEQSGLQYSYYNSNTSKYRYQIVNEDLFLLAAMNSNVLRKSINTAT